MFWVSCLILITQLFTPGLTSPLHSFVANQDATKLDQDKAKISARDDWKWEVADLEKEFKGIWWEQAFKDCNKEQLNKLIFATRGAMWMLDLVADDMKYPYSAAWDRYFGDYSIWYKSGAVNLAVAAQIQHNILQVTKYPKQGHRKSKSHLRKITYTCDYGGQPTGPRKCGSGRTAANTVDPGASSFGTWTVAFCPYFFESDRFEYLEERTKGEKKPYASIGELDTYERAIIHEYMHVDMVSYQGGHIDDINGSTAAIHGDEVQIYGETRCRDFARKWISVFRGGQPNRAVALNADNYAWFFLYHWFDKQWNWHTVPHDELKKAQLQDAVAPGTKPTIEPTVLDIPEPSFPMNEKDLQFSDKIPDSCVVDENTRDENDIPLITCQYVGGDAENWNTPFLSTGDCELSAECSSTFGETAVNPACECKCNGQVTPLRDDRCAGFAGALPGRPRPP